MGGSAGEMGVGALARAPLQALSFVILARLPSKVLNRRGGRRACPTAVCPFPRSRAERPGEPSAFSGGPWCGRRWRRGGSCQRPMPW